MTESGTGAPLPGTWVLAWSNNSTTFVSGTMTDAGGAYQLDLAVGDYKIEFVDPSSGHDVEWYNGHGFATAGDADPISVVADETIIADAALDLPTGTITGTIVQEGTGIPVAGAWAAAMNSSGQPIAIIQADGAGTYTIPSVEPGVYRIAGIDPTGDHDDRMSPNSTTFTDAEPIAVTAGANSTADIALPAEVAAPTAGTIDGTVVDDVTGLPLPGMRIVALTASTFDLTAGATTDANGAYSIPLPDGDYYLQFVDPVRGHQFEWNGNQPNPMGLGDLTAVPTGSVIDAGLAPLQGDLAGTVTADADAAPVAGAWVAAFGATDGRPVAGVLTDANGEYRITGLGAGDYTVLFADPNGIFAAEYYDNTVNNGTNLVTIAGGETATVDAGLA